MYIYTSPELRKDIPLENNGSEWYTDKSLQRLSVELGQEPPELVFAPGVTGVEAVNQYLPLEALGLNDGHEFPEFRVAGIRGPEDLVGYYLGSFYPAKIIIGIPGVRVDKYTDVRLAQYMQHIELALKLWEHPNELAWLQQELAYDERLAEIFAKTWGAIGTGFATVNAGILYDRSIGIISPQDLQSYAIHFFATAGAFGTLLMQKIYQNVIAGVYERYDSRLQKLIHPGS